MLSDPSPFQFLLHALWGVAGIIEPSGQAAIPAPVPVGLSQRICLGRWQLNARHRMIPPGALSAMHLQVAIGLIQGFIMVTTQRG